MVTIDPAVQCYDPAANSYDLSKDPRCLYGWGPPIGFCSREFGHRGLCIDVGQNVGDPGRTRRSPKNWDTSLREECNR